MLQHLLPTVRFPDLSGAGCSLCLGRPLRDGLAGGLGERGFQLVESVVAIATLILVVQAWRGMPPEPPLWVVGDGLWMLASLIVLFASILFMGSLIGNPALPAPHAAREDRKSVV